MSFQWPLAKLDLIQSALRETGNNVPAVADDGSDEWNVASPVYERWIAYVMASHAWGFAVLTIVLQPSPIAPQDSDFDTAYPIPPDCIHVVWIKINQNNPTTSNQPMLTNWKIAAHPTGTGGYVAAIVTNARGGPPPPATPVAPAQITMYYFSNAGALCDITNGSPILVQALTQFVKGGIYQGLHEDVQTANMEYQAARGLLQEARTRYDQQKPKRQFFNSRIGAVRRIRRPWPQTGINNWGSGSGGGGTPG
jgi:hypothetical protein